MEPHSKRSCINNTKGHSAWEDLVLTGGYRKKVMILKRWKQMRVWHIIRRDFGPKEHWLWNSPDNQGATSHGNNPQKV